jgi:transglutaminase-like putative cysteine protease
VSALAGAPPAARPPSLTELAARIPKVALELAAFAALAAFCLAHYGLLVSPAAGGRVTALTAVALVGGGALAASARLRGRAGTLARVAIVVALAVAALGATGLTIKLLLPGNWDDLRDGLDRGFAGLNTFQWPYAGEDHWIRLTVLLVMPLTLVPATALAFWPARRGRAALRAAAIVPLIFAYGTGVTDLELGGWAARGAALLLLIAAYLWLPRVRGRDALKALAAIAACCLAALPLASGLDARDPWIDYRHWNWFAQPIDGTTFQWDHMYGPITWSRTGTKLLDIRSPEAHYWKVETLDRFDGLRWIHSGTSFAGSDPQGDIPQPINQRWNEKITVTVRGLKSKLIVGAGTVYRIDTDRATDDEPDGTVRVLDDALHEGDSYTVYSYVPDPTAAQMRAAPQSYPQRLSEYTYFDLPAPGQSGLDRPDLSATARAQSLTARTIYPPVAGASLTYDEVQRILASPYARAFRLSRRLAAGQPTTYDVVKSVERYLQHGFTYSERPPRRRYPLSSFLFQDKIGYCQQFSGAMALMLRMNGIPARVATGFSPGARNHTTQEYEVRDFDAHSWVEVWFDGIGWVPFDPTPSLAPAASQSSASSRAPSAARGDGGDSGGRNTAVKREVSSGGGGATADDGAKLWPFVVALGTLALGLFGVLWLAGLVRARPHFPATADGAVDELRAALDRLGYAYPARTTLAQLERRLRVTNGEPAARYVRALRTLRYAPPGAARPPGQRQRRELRRALTHGGGPLARLRGLVALPPHPRRRAF